MGLPAAEVLLTEQEYLDGECTSPVRYEYLAGHVFAMAGASQRHATVTGNVFAALRGALRGGPCRAFASDMKVHIAAARAYYYPDIAVTCAERDLADPNAHAIAAPRLIVEVLSPSTERLDRREKLLNYRQIEALQEYVLIDPARPWVELYRRDTRGWLQMVATELEQSMTLASMDVVLPLTTVYEDVAFETSP